MSLFIHPEKSWGRCSHLSMSEFPLLAEEQTFRRRDEEWRLWGVNGERGTLEARGRGPLPPSSGLSWSLRVRGTDDLLEQWLDRLKL